MNYIVPFIVSSFEWIALLSIPIVFLGYYYRNYLKPIILLAFIMSLLSILLRMTPLHVAIIIGIQILILLFLVKFFFKVNFMQAYVITSMGYGFYNFVQMLIIEAVVQALEFPYVQIYFSLPVTATIQLFTAALILGICYGAHLIKFELSELRYLIEDRSMSKSSKNILVLHSVLMFVFICLINFIFLTENFVFKFFTIIITLILTFVMLTVYIIIHSQFQQKRITEAKKFYLDQEQQTATIVKKLSEDYQGHFKAISKLCESDSSHLIKKYLDENQLYHNPAPPPGLLETNHRSGLGQLDEMLYALLINKRKLAAFLNVSIDVTTDIKDEVQITLEQVRNLSIILDDLILVLYQSPEDREKRIDFHIEINNQGILYEISSPIHIREEQSAEMQLYDALLRFKKGDGTVHTELKPVHIRIYVPLTKSGGVEFV
ncbi:hypothetical protein [Desertibacillus haloalkaliphilus]|uniref:hypothetical protein n=1 Tax=Desertibacillus haloalkaliphilus TaxID=1328930 RepID=UPI001C274D45|nr:hypothetical protein [Desertibacillus haloalkaliphilus]MBU8908750.1 hypothetical protein [Desertibacillus haloalkaliphilus]